MSLLLGDSEVGVGGQILGHVLSHRQQLPQTALPRDAVLAKARKQIQVESYESEARVCDEFFDIPVTKKKADYAVWGS